MAPNKTCTETKQTDGTWVKGAWTEHEMVDQRGYVTDGAEVFGTETVGVQDGKTTRSVAQPMKVK